MSLKKEVRSKGLKAMLVLFTHSVEQREERKNKPGRQAMLPQHH